MKNFRKIINASKCISGSSMDISTHVTIPSHGNFLLYLHATILYTLMYKSLTRLDVLDDTEQKLLPFAVVFNFPCRALQTIISYIMNGIKAAVPLSMTYAANREKE